jgi:tryptophan 2,3-dioxygenase
MAGHSLTHELEQFSRLRLVVLRDGELTAALSAALTEEELFAKVFALAGEHGLDIGAAVLKEIVAANRSSWLQRWLPF